MAAAAAADGGSGGGGGGVGGGGGLLLTLHVCVYVSTHFKATFVVPFANCRENVKWRRLASPRATAEIPRFDFRER